MNLVEFLLYAAAWEAYYHLEPADPRYRLADRFPLAVVVTTAEQRTPDHWVENADRGW